VILIPIAGRLRETCGAVAGRFGEQGANADACVAKTLSPRQKPMVVRFLIGRICVNAMRDGHRLHRRARNQVLLLAAQRPSPRRLNSRKACMLLYRDAVTRRSFALIALQQVSGGSVAHRLSRRAQDAADRCRTEPVR